VQNELFSEGYIVGPLAASRGILLMSLTGGQRRRALAIRRQWHLGVVGTAGFPEKAKVVIVGLRHRSRSSSPDPARWTDIVGIDKSGIPTDVGSTAHASDFAT
jgi:hypothetical protein